MPSGSTVARIEASDHVSIEIIRRPDSQASCVGNYRSPFDFAGRAVIVPRSPTSNDNRYKTLAKELGYRTTRAVGAGAGTL